MIKLLNDDVNDIAKKAVRVCNTSKTFRQVLIANNYAKLALKKIVGASKKNKTASVDIAISKILSARNEMPYYSYLWVTDNL